MAASWRMTDSVNNSNYWFEDGNIVLSIRGTQFRVHRGVLARHSKVFSDMTSIPQPPTADSCPTVPLDDDPQDWETLLKIIYDCDLSHLSDDQFLIHILAAVLRLGRKYAFDKFYESALERLLGAIPSTLWEWDAYWTYGIDRSMITDQDVIDVVNLVIELNFDSQLPVAYFLCLRWEDLEGVFQGHKRIDGSIARLSAESIQTIVLGAQKVQHSEEFMNFQDFCTPTLQCTTKSTCGSAVSKRELMWPFTFVNMALSPLMHPAIEKLCSQCQHELARLRQPHRQKIWTNLPYYFGLAPSKLE